MPNFSPSVPNRPASGLALLAAALLLMGAGCDLSARAVSWNPLAWLSPPQDRSAEVTAALRRSPGLAMTVQPSTFGVTGAVEGLIGGGTPYQVEITASGTGSAALSWTRGQDRGALASERFDASRALLLPAFWKPGAHNADGNGLLWLSPDAYARLLDGEKTDIRIGIGDGAIDTASKALQAFNAIAARLSMSASGVPETVRPFEAELQSESSVFLLRVDGELERVRTFTVRNWFADFVVLKNLENPLVLKVSVNPLAMEALRAFAPEGIDPQAVGYEITSVSSPSSRAPSP